MDNREKLEIYKTEMTKYEIKIAENEQNLLNISKNKEYQHYLDCVNDVDYFEYQTKT